MARTPEGEIPCSNDFDRFRIDWWLNWIKLIYYGILYYIILYSTCLIVIYIIFNIWIFDSETTMFHPSLTMLDMLEASKSIQVVSLSITFDHSTKLPHETTMKFDKTSINHPWSHHEITMKIPLHQSLMKITITSPIRGSPKPGIAPSPTTSRSTAAMRAPGQWAPQRPYFCRRGGAFPVKSGGFDGLKKGETWRKNGEKWWKMVKHGENIVKNGETWRFIAGFAKHPGTQSWFSSHVMTPRIRGYPLGEVLMSRVFLEPQPGRFNINLFVMFKV